MTAIVTFSPSYSVSSIKRARRTFGSPLTSRRRRHDWPSGPHQWSVLNIRVEREGAQAIGVSGRGEFAGGGDRLVVAAGVT
jgi:hypothetical protein